MSDDIQYQRFHIPDAVHLPYAALNVTNQHGVCLSTERARMLKLLGSLGARRDSQLVIYDDLGDLNASRLCWELERFGHPRVALLDGGLVNTPVMRVKETFPLSAQLEGRPSNSVLARGCTKIALTGM